jgi:hypothetical protein
MTLYVSAKVASSEFQTALLSLDEAHIHIVKSFLELTTENTHEKWRKI